MTVTILVVAAFLPALVFLAWIRSSRRHRDPWLPLAYAFFFGAIVAIIIALLLETVALYFLSSPIVREYELFALDPSALTFLTVIVIAPIVEEAAKALGVMRSDRWMRDRRSGLVFGAASGLGFAATENLFYEGAALIEGGVQAFILLALVRTFSSALMHAAATSISGYGVALRRFKGNSWLPYYLIAVLMHATFNLFASFGDLFRAQLGDAASLIGLVFAFLLVIVSIGWIRGKLKGKA